MAGGNELSFLLFIGFLASGQGVATKKGNLYISRAGHDSWPCNQSKPCRSLWRALSLASPEDCIHLDGTNTDEYPYTCQSGSSKHPGMIYVNTSLTFVGSDPMPRIQCASGNTLMFDGSHSYKYMTVIFSGLFFDTTSVSMRDCFVEVRECKFKGSTEGLDFTLRNVHSLRIQITNSIFLENRKAISVSINSTRNTQQETQVEVEIKNTAFKGNNTEGPVESCISIRATQDEQFVNCSINLKNVNFSSIQFKKAGLIYANLQNGHQYIYLESVNFTENRPFGAGFSECSIIATNVDAVISSSFLLFADNNARALNISATNMSLQVSSSNFSGYKTLDKGGTFSLTGNNFCTLLVINSSFLNTYSSLQGGAINVECPHVMVTFQQDVFTDIKAGTAGGGAVSISDSYPSSSNFSSIASRVSVTVVDTWFSSCSSAGPGGAVLINSMLKGSDHVSLRINNSRFEDCTSPGAGGGAVNVETVNATEIKITLFNITFSNCLSHGSGGGVLVGSTSNDSKVISLCMTESHFNGCRSTGKNGGAVGVISAASKSQIRIRNCSFSSNSAWSHGAALALMDPTHVTIEHSNFTNNSAIDCGGAIYFSSASSTFRPKITIRASKFRNNWPSNSGGAIFVAQSIHSLSIEGVTMESNFAKRGYGGAVCSDTSISPLNIAVLNSRFVKNHACQCGGVFSLPGVKNMFHAFNSVFENNSVLKGMAGALYLDKFGLASQNIASFLIFNTTFRNCQAGSELGPHSAAGGAIYVNSIGNSSLEISHGSRFLGNSAPIEKGGAIFARMAPDELKDAGCLNKTGQTKFREWNYNNTLTVVDTTFEGNVAQIGGALYLSRGMTSFQNCSFINNLVSAQGGHVFTEHGSASVIMRNCSLNQTKTELRRESITFVRSSFLHLESAGPFIVRNSTLDSSPYGDTDLLIVAKGSLVDFGHDNLTAYYCPVGSQMQIQNFTNDVTATCKIRITVLAYKCLSCPKSSYSLQRGFTLSGELAPGFQCLPCPFGANCSQNIVAQTNFWGFIEQETPPSLKFILCPLGYCNQSNPAVPFSYNGCQGNRSGVLCGRCKAGYTETLYSTHCRPSGNCKDYWFWPVSWLYMSLMAFYLTFNPPILPRIQRQVMWFRKPNPTVQEPDFDRGYLKIIFYFYQTANLLIVSTSTQSITKTYFIEPFLGVFNFQQKVPSGGLICPFSGLTVVTKQLVSVLQVLGTLFMIFVFCGVHLAFGKLRGQRMHHWGAYFGGVLGTLLLGYSSLASASLRLLRCVAVGSDQRLFYDGSVLCLQRWQYLVIASIVMFVVPFVFVLYWGSLKLHRVTISVEKFLLACFFPLPFIVLWIGATIMRSPDNGDSSFSQQVKESVTRVLYDPFKTPSDNSNGALSWESVMIARRFVLILIALDSNYLSRLLLMSIFCVLFLLHHVMKQPFRDPYANAAETFSLFFLTVLAILNVFFASFLSLAVESAVPLADWRSVCYWIEVGIIGLLPSLSTLLVVFFFLSQLCRFIVVTFNVLRFFFQFYCKSWCNRDAEDRRPFISVT